jgi:hypothetical protein
MTRKLKNIITTIICVGLFLLPSCKGKEYKFVVSNKTNYRIDNIKIGCGDGATQISVDPNASSQTITLRIKRGIGFTEPVLCAGVTDYSDNSGSYKHTTGSTISISNLSKKSTNIIEITLRDNPSPPNDIFSVRRP